MFNPFKAVGDFFSGFFGGKKKNDDEERRRREAAAKAQQQQAQRQSQQQAQQPKQQKQAIVLNQEQKPSFQLGQQPTVQGQPQKPKFGFQLNSDNNAPNAQPKMADLSGGKKLVPTPEQFSRMPKVLNEEAQQKWIAEDNMKRGLQQPQSITKNLLLNTLKTPQEQVLQQIQQVQAQKRAAQAPKKTEELKQKLIENPYLLKTRKDDVNKKYTPAEQKAAMEAANKHRMDKISSLNIFGNLGDAMANNGVDGKERYDYGKSVADILYKAKGNKKSVGDLNYKDLIDNYNNLSGDEQADIRENLKKASINYEDSKNEAGKQYLATLSMLLDKDYGLVKQKDTSFGRNVMRDIKTGGFIRGAIDNLNTSFGGDQNSKDKRIRAAERENLGAVGMPGDLTAGIINMPVDVTVGNIQRTFTANGKKDQAEAQKLVEAYKNEQISLDDLKRSIGSLKSNDNLNGGFLYDENTGKLRKKNLLEATANFAGKTIEAGTTLAPYAAGKVVTAPTKIGTAANTANKLQKMNPAQAILASDVVSGAGQLGGQAMQGKEIKPEDVAMTVAGTLAGNIAGLRKGKGMTKSDVIKSLENDIEVNADMDAAKKSQEFDAIKNADNLEARKKVNTELNANKLPENTNTFHYDGTKPADIVIKLPKVDELRITKTYTEATPDVKLKTMSDTAKQLEAQYTKTNDPVQIQSIHDELQKVNTEIEKIAAEKQQLEANPSQEPIDTQEAKIAEQQAEIAKAAEQQAQAAEAQNSEKAVRQDTTELDTNNAYKQGAFDKNALEARLRQRQADYQADPASAVKAAEDRAIVNREAGYDPTGQVNKAAIATRLNELGVDQNSLNAIAGDGATLNQLNVLLQNTDWSKVKNPAGYIRNAIRNMVDGSKNNPTMAALVDMPKREPLLNDMGEVMTDANGKPLYKTDAPDPLEAPAPTLSERVVFDPEQLSKLTGEERVNYIQGVTSKIANNLENDLQAVGSNTDDFFMKLAQVRRGEADASVFSQAELDINMRLQQDLGDAIAYAEEITGSKFGRQGGEYYSPEYRPGRTDTTSTQQLMQMLDTGELAGSTYSNTRAIPTEELDTSVTPIKEYLNEMYLYGGRNTPEATTASITKSMVNEAVQEGRMVDASNVNVAGAKVNDLFQRLKQAATLGKNDRVKATLHNIFSSDKIEQNVYKIDMAGELNEVGRLLNKDQIVVTDKARGFTLGKKVDSYRIGNSTLGQQGIRDYYAADALANSIVRSTDPRAEFEKALAGLEYITENDKLGVMRDVSKRISDALDGLEPDEVPRDAVANAYSYALKNAVRMNLTELAQRVKFESPTAQKAFNDAVNPILVNEKIQQGYTDAILNSVATWTNNAIRGFNPKSAATELGDFGEINVVAGNVNVAQAIAELKFNPKSMIDVMQEYGRMGGLDPKAEFARSNVGAVQKVAEAVNSHKPLQVLKTIGDPMTLVKAVTVFKESVALKALEKVHMERGLQGIDLKRAVLKDYYETVLPSSPLNRSVLNDNAAKRVAFQYMNWQAMNAIRTTRFLLGQSDAGVLKDMSTGKAAGRFVVDAGATKLSLWAVENTLFGTSLVSALGIFDPTGVLQGDFSGIEDKNIMDRIMSEAGISPLTSLATNYYFSIRREQERANAVVEGEYTKGDKTNPNFEWSNVNADFMKQGKNFMMPGGLQFNRSKDFLEAADRGYATNDEGRITYQTPEMGTADWLRGLISGKGATAAAREYNDSPDLLRQNPLKAITKDQAIDTLFGTRDYNRPLSATTYAPGYSDMAKEAYTKAEEQYGKNSPEARQVMADWIKNGREYNRLYDRFGKDNPEEFKRWTDTYGDDVLTPEKWRVYEGNPAIFDFVKARRQMEARDLGRSIDPIFKDQLSDGTPFTDEMRKMVLQERSAYTGDDMRLREFLYKNAWYSSLKADETAYYQTFIGQRDLKKEGKSDRVVEWNELSKQGFAPEGIKSKYPLLVQQEAINEQYGFGSAESKAWFKTYGNAYREQKAAFESERFGIVNRMRELEGVEPLTHEQYMAKIGFPKQDENGNWTGGKFGKSGYSGGGKSGKRYSGGKSYSGGSYNNDWKKINYVTTSADVTNAPTAKGAKLTKNKLKVNTSAGSKTGRKITIGARSTYRG